eukprot:3060228-Alexandrium_andersonii.AAC.1
MEPWLFSAGHVPGLDVDLNIMSIGKCCCVGFLNRRKGGKAVTSSRARLEGEKVERTTELRSTSDPQTSVESDDRTCVGSSTPLPPVRAKRRSPGAAGHTCHKAGVQVRNPAGEGFRERTWNGL